MFTTSLLAKISPVVSWVDETHHTLEFWGVVDVFRISFVVTYLKLFFFLQWLGWKLFSWVIYLCALWKCCSIAHWLYIQFPKSQNQPNFVTFIRYFDLFAWRPCGSLSSSLKTNNFTKKDFSLLSNQFFEMNSFNKNFRSFIFLISKKIFLDFSFQY